MTPDLQDSIDLDEAFATSTMDLGILGDQGAALLARVAAASNLPSEDRLLRQFRKGEAMELGGLTDAMWRAYRVECGDATSGDHTWVSLAELHDLQEKQGLRPSRPSGTTPARLAMATYKGGACKTTLALHLSHYLAFRGWRVLVVDMDPQGTLSRYLGVPPDQIDPAETMAAAFPDSSGEGRASVPSPKRTHIDGLDLVPASLEMIGSDIAIAAAYMRRDSSARDFYRCLDDAIAQIEAPYDIVLIDTAPAFSFSGLNCLWAATGLIIPIPTAIPDVSATLDFTAMAADIIGSIEHASGQRKIYSPVVAVHSRVMQGTVVDTIQAMTKSIYGKRRLEESIPDSRAVINAMAMMRSVYEITSDEVDIRSLRRARDAYDAFGTRIEKLLRASWQREIRLANTDGGSHDE